MDQYSFLFPPGYLAQVYGVNPQSINGVTSIPVMRPLGQHQRYVYPPGGNQDVVLPHGGRGCGAVPIAQPIPPGLRQPPVYAGHGRQGGKPQYGQIKGVPQGGRSQGQNPVNAIQEQPRQNSGRMVYQAVRQDSARQAEVAADFKRSVCQSLIGLKFKLGGNDYMVEKVLAVPVTGVPSMNDGIRVLKNAQGILVVEKKLKMSTSGRRNLAKAEKKALMQIAKAGGSKHINKIYEAVWDKASLQSSLILEYCNRGTLDHFIEFYKQSNLNIPEMFCCKVLYQLSAALCMCHLGIKDPTNPKDKVEDWNTICHLDIKPLNVFLDYRSAEGIEHLPFIWPRVVLGDFGCAVSRDDIISRKADHKLQPTGTPYWFPPENSNTKTGMRKIGQYGKYTDIWQMGGVIQTMCRLSIAPEMYWVDVNRAAGDGYSAELDEAIVICMGRDVDLRPTALDVATAVKELMDSRDY